MNEPMIIIDLTHEDDDDENNNDENNNKDDMITKNATDINDTNHTQVVTPSYLSNLNMHERDQFITFEETNHIYNIRGNTSYISTTTLIQQFYKKFDADVIIKKMRTGKNWNVNHKNYFMTDDQIKESWELKKNTSATTGTLIHYNIECYYNQLEMQNQSEYIELTHHFPNYLHYIDTVKKYTAYRTEWLVYDDLLQLAGSVDMVYQVHPDNSNEIAIYDWKCIGEMKLTNPYDKMLPPLNHLPDTNYWHYVIQLNIYKYMLEKWYGKIVKEMVLVVLHNSNSTYMLYDVPFLKKEIDDIMNYRMNMIN